MKRTSDRYFKAAETPKRPVGSGIFRQLLGFNDDVLMARVEFDEGAVGEMHSHPHSQVTYVESGEFDVTIDGVRKRLRPGDGYYVDPNLDHGAVCLKAGVLLDVFIPVREDFLEEDLA